MALLGRDLVAQVSRYLSDQERGFEFEHWSEDDLFDYFRQAVLVVSARFRSRFTARTEVVLVPGQQQKLPDTCEGMADRYITDASGKVLSSVDTSAAVKFPGTVCATDRAFAPTGFRYDDASGQYFFIDPPAPADVSASVFVNCYIPPDPASVDEAVDLPSIVGPAVFEFMLYYAWGTDTEAVPLRERSALHWANGMILLGEATKTPTKVKAAPR